MDLETLVHELRSIQSAAPANEAEVETKILLHVFRLLGYSDADRADKPGIPMALGRERKIKHPDFVFYQGGDRTVSNALVTVEAKNLPESLEGAEDQAKSYALWAGTPFYLVCNGIDLRAVKYLPGAEDFQSVNLKVCELESNWEKLDNFLSRNETILEKERLTYISLYLPHVENLPPQEFFEEYISRLQVRFSTAASIVPPLALSPGHLVEPNIPVSVRLRRSETIWTEADLTRLLSSDGARLFVEGAAGSGKSTLCKRVISFATHDFKNLKILPIYVSLGILTPDSIETAFSSACHDLGMRVLPNLFRTKLNETKSVLILDGLDEMESTESNKAGLKSLIEGCGSNRLMLTTRPTDVTEYQDILGFEDFDQGEISTLSDSDVRNVLLGYLGSNLQTDSLLASIPVEMRSALKSPLFALMVIRVAQSASSWEKLTTFKLFERYVNVLENFFNYGRRVEGDTSNAFSALEALALTLGTDSSDLNPSLDKIREKAEEQGLGASFLALLRTGLITSVGGSVHFAHKSFQEFGIARAVLRSIREANLLTFSDIQSGASVSEMVLPELSSNDVETLIKWLRIDSNPVRRRVLAIFKFQAPQSVLQVVKKILMQKISTRTWDMGVKVIAGNDENLFLKALADDLITKKQKRKAHILANALGGATNREYLPILLKMATTSMSPTFTRSLINFILVNESLDVLPKLVGTYRKHHVVNRREFARTINLNRSSQVTASMLNLLIPIEKDGGAVLLLLHAGRHVIKDIDATTLSIATKRVGSLVSPERYQRRAAARLCLTLNQIKLTKEQQELNKICSEIGHDFTRYFR